MCNHDNYKKNGKDRYGKQRYICKSCGSTMQENYSLRDKRNRLDREKDLKLYQKLVEGKSCRVIGKELSCSKDTVNKRLKKLQEELIYFLLHNPNTTFNQVCEGLLMESSLVERCLMNMVRSIEVEKHTLLAS